MHEHVIMYTDGGSRGNPGPGAGAYVLTDGSKNLIGGKGVFLKDCTNNIAEYTGMAEGLAKAVEMQVRTIEIYSDSELMVKQLNGIYKVKSPNLKGLHAQCKESLSQFASWKVSHVYRESNKEADQLANDAMDVRKDVELEGKTAAKGKGKKLRIGVLLSGGGTTMENIHREIRKGAINAQIVAIISSRKDVRGVKLAEKMGLTAQIIRKKDFDSIESFSDKIVETLNEAKVDLVVQAGWLCLWQIPDEYENRVMNIHPALLPNFGGKGMWGHHVHEAVLKAGCKVSGCTVHFCTNEYDKGPIITQKGCAAKDTDTPDELAKRVFQQECKAYPEAIRLFAQGRITVEDGIVKIKS